jgi:Tfp pilus assembly protein PilF
MSRTVQEQEMNQGNKKIGIKPQAGWRLIGGAGLLLVVVCLAYFPAYRGGFYADDEGLLVRNERLHTPGGLGEMWSDLHGTDGLYYPLTFSTYWVEYQLWGLNPLGYHIDNILLHAINAILLWVVFRRFRLPGAWFAAAVFALHPVHVESVAWVTERRNTLSTLFYLLSLLAYLNFRPLTGARSKTEGRAVESRRAWLMYAASLLFFLAALLSKTFTLTLPAAILLLVWWKRGRLLWGDVRPLLPFFALGLAVSLLTVGLEKSLVQAGGPGWGSYSILDRTLIAARAVWFYLGTVLFPVGLSFHYPQWVIDARVWWQHLYVAAGIALIVVLFALRRRIGRGPVTALLFFVGTLVPVLGFINYFYMMYAFVADRFLYLPSLSIIALVAAGCTIGVKRLGPGVTRAAPAICVIVLAVLGAAVWQRSEAYKTPETLYRDVLVKYPDSWLGHHSLGCVLGATSRPQEAVPHFETAIRLNPNFPAIRGYLGVVYSQLGRFDDAIPMYTEALKQNPNDEVIRTNLGFTYVNLGEFEKGIKEYEKALQINPEYAPALKNLTQIVLYRIDSLFKAGQAEDAREFASEARALAVGLGAQPLVGQIDERVRRYETPQQ